MLAKPKAGWTTVTIGEFEAEASYLVDIPFEWLKGCLIGLKEKIPITLFIDEEGSEEYIVSYYEGTHIIIDRDDQPQCMTYRNIDFMDITKSVIDDIRLYFEDWVQWSPYEDWKKRKVELKELILETEKTLMKEVERCNKKLK